MIYAEYDEMFKEYEQNKKVVNAIVDKNIKKNDEMDSIFFKLVHKLSDEEKDAVMYQIYRESSMSMTRAEIYAHRKCENKIENEYINFNRAFYVIISNMVAAVWAISHNSASYLYLALGYIFIFFLMLVLCFAAITIAAPYKKDFEKITFKSYVLMFLFFFIAAAIIIFFIKN